MTATSLPPSCGEATGIPGTPSVGCVAVLQYAVDTVGGFSCCVVATREAVYLLGPDLESSDGSLASVRLWRPHAQTNAARISSLVAFLLRPAAHKVHGTLCEEGVVAEEVCAIVAWESDGGCQQHITALFFPLVSVLSAVESAPFTVNETSFVQARNQQRLLRLFYHPLFTGASFTSDHVVLCSCYDETVRKDARLTHNEERNRHVLTPGDPRGVFSGVLSFVVCSEVPNDACKWNVEWFAQAPTSVTSWLAHCHTDGVVCAVAVQQALSHVIIALGMTNGRVVLFHEDGRRLPYRFGGPIADLAFVYPWGIHNNERYRNPVVNQFLQHQQRKEKSSLEVSSPVTEEAVGVLSLVILDSLGRVVILCDVNGGTPKMQVVPDIQQFITLAKHRVSCLSNPNHNTGDVEETAGVRPVTMSSKNFFDLSSLRLFFQRRKQKDTPLDLAGEKVNRTPAGEAEDTKRSSRDRKDALLAGHILSRGLLSLALAPVSQGRVELVVSTMGQSIVSIPFDKNEGVFSIAGFIVAPEPMFFVGFVDFFNTGVAELVMTGMHHVLVARRSRHQLMERATLLLRLMESGEARSSTSEDPVDS
ncbi:hypothetical protein DQ04_03701080 [Trypanosoma grayi]|uniref:hypothetical protein n=1 Tax=Trypanosoma grayi TaxID=71804 RepID=UPI0004F41125|nr:hypothetical protein DQ04_03701080 [Trypanosoma grayi]KEG10452.1 hypothetical protein DQ04_03701080 [Trypanosoma grayi]